MHRWAKYRVERVSLKQDSAGDTAAISAVYTTHKPIRFRVRET
jgi:hypothetical protein